MKHLPLSALKSDVEATNSTRQLKLELSKRFGQKLLQPMSHLTNAVIIAILQVLSVT